MNNLQRLLNLIQNKNDKELEKNKIYKNLENYSEIRKEFLIKSRVKVLEKKLKEYSLYKDYSKITEIYWRACAGWDITKKDVKYILENIDKFPNVQLNGHVLYISILMENFEKRGLVIWDNEKNEYILKETKLSNNCSDTPLTEEQLKDIQFSEKYTNYHSRDDLYQLECDSMFTKTLRNIPEKDIKFYDIVFSKRLNQNEGFIKYNFTLKKYQVGYFFNEDFSYKNKVQDVLKLI